MGKGRMAADVLELATRCAAEIVARACDVGIAVIRERMWTAYRTLEHHKQEVRQARTEDKWQPRNLAARAAQKKAKAALKLTYALRRQYKGYMLYVTERNGGIRHRRYYSSGAAVKKIKGYINTNLDK